MKNSIYFGLFLAVIGIIGIVLGLKEKGLAAAASAQPEEISLAKLIARGPDGNPNIILTDFALGDNFVFQTRNGVWQNAWVPAVPRDAPALPQGGFPKVGLPQGLPGRAGRPAVIHALIFTINARNEAGLFQLCEQPRLHALVTNRIMSLGGEQKRLLEQSYPGTDFSRCLIIQEGRLPAGPTKLILMIGGGSLAALAGFGLLGFAAVKWQQERTSGQRRSTRDDDDEDDRPRKRRPRSQDLDDDDRPTRKRSRDDDDEDDRPSRRRNRGDGPDADDDRSSRRSRRDDPDDRPARRRSRDDDQDEPRPRRRSRSDDD